jgi:saccharopine dehydrogenase-like NADP-dependent oxidoreductase
VDFASIGRRRAYYTAHPEPWTLSKSLPAIPTITCKGGVAGLDDAVPLLRALGLTSNDPIDIDGRLVSPRVIALSLLGRLPDPDPLPPPVSGLIVTARGRLNGRAVERRSEVMAPSRMTLLTGLPTAVGVSLVAAGASVPLGAVPPEIAFSPTEFLDRLSRLGVEIRTEQVELSQCS